MVLEIWCGVNIVWVWYCMLLYRSGQAGGFSERAIIDPRPAPGISSLEAIQLLINYVYIFPHSAVPCINNSVLVCFRYFLLPFFDIYSSLLVSVFFLWSLKTNIVSMCQKKFASIQGYDCFCNQEVRATVVMKWQLQRGQGWNCGSRFLPYSPRLDTEFQILFPPIFDRVPRWDSAANTMHKGSLYFRQSHCTYVVFQILLWFISMLVE